MSAQGLLRWYTGGPWRNTTTTGPAGNRVALMSPTHTWLESDLHHTRLPLTASAYTFCFERGRLVFSARAALFAPRAE